MNDISKKEKQVRQLQKKISKDEDIDVTEEFDELVDYLQTHGYNIVSDLRINPKAS